LKYWFQPKTGLANFAWFAFQLLLHSTLKLNSVNNSTNSNKRKLTLAQYVRRRNGVSLGSSGSLRNMFYRSLGAGTFAGFWRYWNPIWGYYLSRYAYAPLRHWLPPAISVVITFVLCGALHDVVVSALTGRIVTVFTLWFLFLGTGVAIGQAMQFNYSHFVWPIRAFINISYISISLVLTYAIRALLA